MNKDFYEELPGMVCAILDDLIEKYGDKQWFNQAWEEYRQHIKDNSMDDMKMPGYVFNKYIDNKKKQQELKMSKKIKYRNFLVSQASINHVLICKDGELVFHSQINKELTDDDLKKQVDFYLDVLLSMIEKMEDE